MVTVRVCVFQCVCVLDVYVYLDECVVVSVAIGV